MRRQKQTRGLTQVEVLMLIGIFASLLVMLLPWLQGNRENARKLTCADHMRKLGQAYLHYEAANQRLVASSVVTRDADGKILAVDGWSWMVQILPFMDEEGPEEVYPAGGLESPDCSRAIERRELYEKCRKPDVAARGLYDRLDVKEGRPLVESAGIAGTPHADAMATRFSWLLCPSYDGSPYADPTTQKAAITNFRAVGATHIESLSVASPNPLTPKYNPASSSPAEYQPDHPDGFCFPGSELTSNNVRQDTSYRIWLTESLEPRFARWTVGAEATVVGLPSNVEFEGDGKLRPWAPVGHGVAVAKDPSCRGYSDSAYANKKRWDERDRKELETNPNGDAIYWNYRTYLEWDYDQEPYDGKDGMQAGKYGPSSNHPGVHHGFLDGSVHCIRRDIDVGFYMDMIGRNLW